MIALRTQRANNYAQVVTLHQLEMTTLIEKERLEKALSQPVLRPIVFQKVLITLKETEEKVKDLEVNGVGGRLWSLMYGVCHF